MTEQIIAKLMGDIGAYQIKISQQAARIKELEAVIEMKDLLIEGYNLKLQKQRADV